MLAEHSRALLFAEGATGRTPSELERRLDDSLVVISMDSTMPMSTLATRVVLTTLRRGPGELYLSRDGVPSAVVHELEAAVSAVDPDRPLHVTRRLRREASSLLHVGPFSPSGAIRIVPDGYGAHVAGASSAVIRPARQGNALGAIYAAALGTAEVFKHTAGVLRGRRVLHRHLRFCPVALSADLQRVPDLDASLKLDLALIGVGAVGTGIAVILGELGAEGTMVAVDRQRFTRENRGTYSLGDANDVAAAPWKVDLARRVLPGFDVTPFCDAVENLPAAVDAGDVPWARLVLTGLDSPEARRQAQRLWPDRLIDGATGDTFLGLHDYDHGSAPCMICVFRERRDRPSGVERLARRLGLPAELVARGDALLSREHLIGLTKEQRRLVEPYVGKAICGLARATGLTSADAAGFMPSVPFISLQAACLSVGRLLAHQLDLHPRANLVQYDGLFGPQAATLEHMVPRANCYCQSRARTIASVRAKRASRSPA